MSKTIAELLAEFVKDETPETLARNAERDAKYDALPCGYDSVRECYVHGYLPARPCGHSCYGAFFHEQCPQCHRITNELLEVGAYKLSVSCIVTRADGLILGVSRRGQPTLFGLPGGKVDDGETIHEAMARELQEETGLIADRLSLVFSDVSAGDVTYWNSSFTCEAHGELKAEEGFTVAWVTKETLIAGPFGAYNKKLFEHLGMI